MIEMKISGVSGQILKRKTPNSESSCLDLYGKPDHINLVDNRKSISYKTSG